MITNAADAAAHATMLALAAHRQTAAGYAFVQGIVVSCEAAGHISIRNATECLYASNLLQESNGLALTTASCDGGSPPGCSTTGGLMVFSSCGPSTSADCSSTQQCICRYNTDGSYRRMGSTVEPPSLPPPPSPPPALLSPSSLVVPELKENVEPTTSGTSCQGNSARCSWTLWRWLVIFGSLPVLLSCCCACFRRRKRAQVMTAQRGPQTTRTWGAMPDAFSRRNRTLLASDSIKIGISPSSHKSLRMIPVCDAPTEFETHRTKEFVRMPTTPNILRGSNGTAGHGLLRKVSRIPPIASGHPTQARSHSPSA